MLFFHPHHAGYFVVLTSIFPRRILVIKRQSWRQVSSSFSAARFPALPLGKEIEASAETLYKDTAVPTDEPSDEALIRQIGYEAVASDPWQEASEKQEQGTEQWRNTNPTAQRPSPDLAVGRFPRRKIGDGNGEEQQQLLGALYVPEYFAGARPRRVSGGSY